MESPPPSPLLLTWAAVVLAGALGGAVSTFVGFGSDVAFPRFLHVVGTKRPGLGLVLHLMRNVVFGAVAAFVVWGLNAGSADFSTTSIALHQVASAIIVGGGGVSVLNNLFRQGLDNAADRNADTTVDTLTEALDLADQELEEAAHPEEDQDASKPEGARGGPEVLPGDAER